MILVFYFDITKQSTLFGDLIVPLNFKIMYAVQTLLNKIQNSKSIDFGDLFNETLDVFKKVWVQGLLLQLFSLIIMLPFINEFLCSVYQTCT